MANNKIDHNVTDPEVIGQNSVDSAAEAYQDVAVEETPIIIIEHVDEEGESDSSGPAEACPAFFADPSASRGNATVLRWWMVTSVIIGALIIAGSIWGYWFYHRYVNVGVSISRTPNENIELLQVQFQKAKPQIIVSHDSILGVAMDLYELRGLKGEVVMQVPDSADTSIMFLCRCADYGKDKKPIGSLVSKGKLLCDDNNRLGYCAMLDKQTVIGVSRYEDVRNFCMEADGSFFRQFILVSNGELPPLFHLHGKVERRALARTDDGRLFFVQSRYPEVMTGFADALRERGFIDAIYITGGTDYAYYRTRNLHRHHIGKVTAHPKPSDATAVPWMVFRR